MKFTMMFAATMAMMTLAFAVNDVAKADPPTHAEEEGQTWFAATDLSGKVLQGTEWAGTQADVVRGDDPSGPALYVTLTFTSAFDEPPACEANVSNLISSNTGDSYGTAIALNTSTTSATFEIPYSPVHYKEIDRAVTQDADGYQLIIRCDKV